MNSLRLLGFTVLAACASTPTIVATTPIPTEPVVAVVPPSIRPPAPLALVATEDSSERPSTIRSVAMTPDGRFVAWVDDASTVTLIEVASRQVRATRAFATALRSPSLQFVDSGWVLRIDSDLPDATCWALDDGSLLDPASDRCASSGRSGGAAGAREVLSSDGTCLLRIDDAGEVVATRTRDRAVVGSLFVRSKDAPIDARSDCDEVVAIAEFDLWIFAHSSDGYLRTDRRSSSGHNGPPHSVRTIAGAPLVVGFPAAVALVDRASGDEVALPRSALAPATGVYAGDDGTFVFYGGERRTVILEGTSVRVAPCRFGRPFRDGRGHLWILGASWYCDTDPATADADRMVSAVRPDGGARVLARTRAVVEIEDGRERTLFTESEYDPAGTCGGHPLAAYSGDGRRLAIVCSGRFQLIDLASGRAIAAQDVASHEAELRVSADGLRGYLSTYYGLFEFRFEVGRLEQRFADRAPIFGTTGEPAEFAFLKRRQGSDWVADILILDPPRVATTLRTGYYDLGFLNVTGHRYLHAPECEPPFTDLATGQPVALPDGARIVGSDAQGTRFALCENERLRVRPLSPTEGFGDAIDLGACDGSTVVTLDRRMPWAIVHRGNHGADLVATDRSGHVATLQVANVTRDPSIVIASSDGRFEVLGAALPSLRVRTEAPLLEARIVRADAHPNRATGLLAFDPGRR